MKYYKCDNCDKELKKRRIFSYEISDETVFETPGAVAVVNYDVCDYKCAAFLLRDKEENTDETK